MKTILVTGGAGYIGSHTVLQLLEQNYGVVVLDNLANSSAESLRRVESITGKSVTFVQGDIRDTTVSSVNTRLIPLSTLPALKLSASRCKSHWNTTKTTCTAR